MARDSSHPRGQRSVSPLHGIWVSVFALEAVVLREDLAEQLSTAAYTLLFTVLLVTELRSSRNSD